MGKKTVRHYVADTDLQSKEIFQVLATALDVKKNPWKYREDMKNKILGMIFQKPSTRTRVSFEGAMLQMGGHAIYLSSKDIQLGRGETIADTSRVLSRYVDVIMARVFSHKDIETLAEHSRVPVINGLSDDLHPCQALADLMTIQEIKGKLNGIVLAYVGDGNNVCHSLILSGLMVGMDIKVATPEGYEPQETVVQQGQEIARTTGGSLKLVRDPVDAVSGADVVYTDVWASMGQEEESEIRRRIFRPYQVNESLFDMASEIAIFMHCLPAHRGEEVTDAVIDSPRSVVWEQAENRLHVQKALLIHLLETRI